MTFPSMSKKNVTEKAREEESEESQLDRDKAVGEGKGRKSPSRAPSLLSSSTASSQ